MSDNPGTGSLQNVRDLLMTGLAALLRNATHSDGLPKPWTVQATDWITYGRFGVVVFAPLTAILAASGNSTLAWWCLGLTITAQATDLIDGPWARVIAFPTPRGEYLDNLFDAFAKYTCIIIVALAGGMMDLPWLLWLGELRMFLEVVMSIGILKPMWQFMETAEEPPGLPDYVWDLPALWLDTSAAGLVLAALNSVSGWQHWLTIAGFTTSALATLMVLRGMQLDWRYFRQLKRCTQPLAIPRHHTVGGSATKE